MKFIALAAVLSLNISTAITSPLPNDKELDRLQETANGNKLARLQAKYDQAKSIRSTDCTSDNIAVRQEFGSLSQADRKAYTDAVLCLQSKGANTPADLVPGAKSRFDDFVAVHINQTKTIHWTGKFLSWHRYFTWVYEQALREECGYQGYQPYWDWPLYAASPQTSPIFNGDEYSMSGNGAFISGHKGIGGFPPGLGGGCVSQGPFANMSVNLGPVELQNATAGPDGGLGYNPRCLKRDVGPAIAMEYTNSTAVSDLINNNNDIGSFQTVMQEGSDTQLSVHTGGHFTIGGDPGGDIFTSPGDPVFYLHHAQIDRVWTMWQDLDPTGGRNNEIAGTETENNNPPSANTTLNEPVQVGFAGGRTFQIQDLVSTTEGPFCYMYQ